MQREDPETERNIQREDTGNGKKYIKGTVDTRMKRKIQMGDNGNRQYRVEIMGMDRKIERGDKGNGKIERAERRKTSGSGIELQTDGQTQYES